MAAQVSPVAKMNSKSDSKSQLSVERTSHISHMRRKM